MFFVYIFSNLWNFWAENETFSGIGFFVVANRSKKLFLNLSLADIQTHICQQLQVLHFVQSVSIDGCSFEQTSRLTGA